MLFQNETGEVSGEIMRLFLGLFDDDIASCLIKGLFTYKL